MALSLLGLLVEVLNAVISCQTRTKARNSAEKRSCEKYMPATKLFLIHPPSRESQTV